MARYSQQGGNKLLRAIPGMARYGQARPGKARQGAVRCGKARRGKGSMPKRRQPKEIWQRTRLIVLERDGWACVRCHIALTEATAHIDHVKSGKLAGNELTNLRALCRRCHVLRADHRHRGMIASALRDGIIPPNWRELVWEG